MIVKQTTTIVFEYPQDYLQEQEWLKEKAEYWIHKGTDPQGSAYWYQVSYAIGEQQIINDSQGLVDDEFNPYDEECMKCKHLKLRCEFVPSYCKYELRDEPQTERRER